jgi:hypothetical protein
VDWFRARKINKRKKSGHFATSQEEAIGNRYQRNYACASYADKDKLPRPEQGAKDLHVERSGASLSPN